MYQKKVRQILYQLLSSWNTSLRKKMKNFFPTGNLVWWKLEKMSKTVSFSLVESWMFARSFVQQSKPLHSAINCWYFFPRGLNRQPTTCYRFQQGSHGFYLPFKNCLLAFYLVKMATRFFFFRKKVIPNMIFLFPLL